MIDLSPTSQIERLRARYTRLARVGGFVPPAPDADAASLQCYWYLNKERLDEADILDEIERMAPPQD